jgi:hypothetical protein
MQHNNLNEMSSITRQMPFIYDKFVVDFVNGIQVNQDHIRVQTQRTGFFAQLMDSVKGTGAQRQIEINQNTAQGLTASLQWLTQLTEALALNNFALGQVNERVNQLKCDIAKVAHYAADTRQLLNELSQQIHARCDSLEHEMLRVGLVQRAQLNIEAIFSQWEAGQYQHLSLAGRCYVALEALYWGGFGDHLRHDPHSDAQRQLNTIVRNKVLTHLSRDAEAASNQRFLLQHWLDSPANETHILARSALAYMGNAANEREQPFVYTATQQPSVWSLHVPRICSAERLSTALMAEVLEERAYA